MEIGLYGNRSIRRYPTNNTDIRKPENIYSSPLFNVVAIYISLVNRRT